VPDEQGIVAHGINIHGLLILKINFEHFKVTRPRFQ